MNINHLVKILNKKINNFKDGKKNSFANNQIAKTSRNFNRESLVIKFPNYQFF
jgi:hypothetical protein